MSLSYRGSLYGSSSSSSTYRSGGSSTSSAYGRSSNVYGSSRSSLSNLRGSAVPEYRRSTSFESSSGLGTSSSYLSRSSYASTSSTRPGYSYSSAQSAPGAGVGRVSSDSVNTDRQRRRISETASSAGGSSESSSSSVRRDFQGRRTLSNAGEETATTTTAAAVPSTWESESRSYRRRFRTQDSDGGSEAYKRRSRTYEEDKGCDDVFDFSADSGSKPNDTAANLERGNSWRLKQSVSLDLGGENVHASSNTEKNGPAKDESFDQKLATYVSDCESQSSVQRQQLSQSGSGSSSSSAVLRRSSRDGTREHEGSEQQNDNENVSSENLASAKVDTSKSRYGVFLTDRFSKLGVSTCAVSQPPPATRRSSMGSSVAASSNPTPAQLEGVDFGQRGVQSSPYDQVSKPRLPNGTAKTSSRSAAALPGAGPSGKTKAAQEIERLESLCEARTKELTQTRIQLRASSQAFDAVAVLLNYCCAELQAFECPQLATKLVTVQKQLEDCLAETAELTTQKESLTQNVSQVTKEKEDAELKVEETLSAAQAEKEEHQRLTQEMDQTHNAALTTQRDELTNEHNNEVKKVKRHHEQQIQLLKQSHERKISDLTNEGKMEMSQVRLAHLEEIQSLRNKHDSQMEELHKQHRNKLEDITQRFENIKRTLSDKVESLKVECEDHLHRARCSEEALQKDADVKVQMALAPYLSLPKEIESLKTVVEMKNDEIQKLRSRNMDLDKQLEEIPIARDKIISLQQKVENLEAIINIKTDHEKQLHEKCQVLMRKCDRETRANKRLSMDYEQVVWRMSQSEYGGSSESLTKRQLSRSPPRSETTSPDARRRVPMSSPNGEVKLRVKKRTESDSERNMRSRSATFVLEKDEDINELTQSPPPSPLSTPRRWKKRLEKEEMESREEFSRRMCQSAGAELTMELNEHRAVIDFPSLDSNGEMVGSYTRSLSGVSDSGVCDGLNSGNFDSLTGSDMLNSSIFSADSEGLHSNNISMMMDSMRDDSESLPGHEIASSNTVVDMSAIPWTQTPTDGTPSSFSESSSFLSSSISNNGSVIEKTMLPSSSDGQRQDLFLDGGEEEVFKTEDIS